jgi:hypothetical protein
VRTGALDGLGDLPLVVELDDAARRIEAAILNRARVVRFPWSLGVVFRAVAMLPARVRDPLIRRATTR